MILVTGATGQNGGAVAAALDAMSVSYRALVRDRARLAPASTREVVEGHFDDPASLARALDGVTDVFLVSRYEPRMAELEAKAVRACERAGVRRIVQLSGIGADPASPVTTFRWLGEVEQAIGESRCAGVYLRAASFMQNLFAHAASIAAADRFATPLGLARLTYVDVADIGRVAAAVLTSDGHDGRLYEVTGSEQFTQNQVAAEMSRAFGRPIRHVPISFDAAEDGLIAAGVPPALAAALINLWRHQAEVPAPPVLTDTVERLTGRAPRRLEQFLRENRAKFAGGSAEPNADRPSTEEAKAP